MESSEASLQKKTGKVLDTSAFAARAPWTEFATFAATANATTSGFNGGVQLHHLARMRETKFAEGLPDLVAEMVGEGIVLSESDQTYVISNSKVERIFSNF